MFFNKNVIELKHPYANNKVNYLGVLDGSFIPREDAEPYAVSLLKTMVQPQSLQDRSPINYISTSVENIDAWQHQKDNTGVVLGVPNNAHHKCCTFNPTLNEIDCMMKLAPLEFSFTPKKWCYIKDLEILKRV